MPLQARFVNCVEDLHQFHGLVFRVRSEVRTTASHRMVCSENRACSDSAILALEDQTPQIWPVLEHSLSVVDTCYQ